MLKGIPAILTPELLKILMEMGHGDEIVIGDGNFPAASIAPAGRLVRLDGNSGCEVLDAILKLFPLDSYVEEPVTLMSVVPGDDVHPTIWNDYKAIIQRYEPDRKLGFIDRFGFYERARNAYAVVSTGETAIYANLILKKGVIK